jgi:hypothetical protein
LGSRGTLRVAALVTLWVVIVVRLERVRVRCVAARAIVVRR